MTEIPSYLKQLARLITRGFYQIEDALIMDMLVRHSCKYSLECFLAVISQLKCVLKCEEVM